MSTKVYDVITDRILSLLDQGVVPWRKPWRTGAGDGFPVNIRGTAYRGINVFMLGAVAQCEDYASPVWLTYKQAQQHGGHVRKGEKSTPVVFWLWRHETDDNGARVKGGRSWASPRYYRVFNLGQCEDVALPERLEPTPEADAPDPIAAAEAIVSAMPNPPTIQEGGPVEGRCEAYYKPSTDTVRVPKRTQYDDAEHFYATLFHELGHSTGHASRLNREGITELSPFGSHTYSREELVAEMTSAMLCGVAGIDAGTLDNAAAYIEGWRSVLGRDPKIVVQAASLAQRAADHVRGVQWEAKGASDEATTGREAA